MTGTPVTPSEVALCLSLKLEQHASSPNDSAAAQRGQARFIVGTLDLCASLSQGEGDGSVLGNSPGTRRKVSHPRIAVVIELSPIIQSVDHRHSEDMTSQAVKEAESPSGP